MRKNTFQQGVYSTLIKRSQKKSGANVMMFDSKKIICIYSNKAKTIL